MKSFKIKAYIAARDSAILMGKVLVFITCLWLFVAALFYSLKWAFTVFE